jgi:hypothetical protein
MPVYSEVLNDEEIIKLVKGKYQNILIVGCGSCMNESLAYLHDSPIFVKGTDGNNIPHSVLTEIQRIADLLEKEGCNVKYLPLPSHSNSLCQINSDEPMYPLSMENNPEIILAVCCPPGTFGLKAVANNVPIIKVTRQKGFLAYRFVDGSDGIKRMVKEHSKVFNLPEIKL